jgi:transposase
MQTASKSLPDNPLQLKEMLLSERIISAQRGAEIVRLKQQYQHMLEQFRASQQRQFGQSSESSPNQAELFDEVEQTLDELADNSPEKAVAGHIRQSPKRQPLPADLPREVIVHDIPDSDKSCTDCGHDLHRMGEEKSEQLEFIPASIKVIEHQRPKYSCRHCEQQGTQVDIKIAPVPPAPIPKSFASAALLSQIITSKYQYALPLYRQESLFKQYGIDLSRKTMASWMMRSAELSDPMIDRLRQIQLQQTVINADETPLKVIREDKNQCYMWVYCTGTDSPPKNKSQTDPPNIVLYDYQNSRAGHCAKDYLQDYQSYLQVDGYAGYEKTDATLVGCFAHARRKFIEAQKIQVKGKTGKADWAINHIQKLYRLEKEMKGQPAAEKKRIRQEDAKPLLDAFKTWLDKSTIQVPPKSAIGKAIGYSLRQWPKLIRYIEHGNLNIDNNRAERAIKPFVIGRKNWMFSNTANGAKASAVLYSLIETATANGLVPFDYIKYLLDELSKKPDDIDHLLPWNVDLA